MNDWANTVNKKFDFGGGDYPYIKGIKEIDAPVDMFKKAQAQKINSQVQRLMLAKAAAENPDKVLEEYTSMMGTLANASDKVIGALLADDVLLSFQQNMPFLSKPEANAVYLQMVTDFADRYANMITMANPVALRIAQDIGTELSAPVRIGSGGGSRRSHRSSGRTGRQ